MVNGELSKYSSIRIKRLCKCVPRSQGITYANDGALDRFEAMVHDTLHGPTTHKERIGLIMTTRQSRGLRKGGLRYMSINRLFAPIRILLGAISALQRNMFFVACKAEGAGSISSM
jgi:hypothetical protein